MVYSKPEDRSEQLIDRVPSDSPDLREYLALASGSLTTISPRHKGWLDTSPFISPAKLIVLQRT